MNGDRGSAGCETGHQGAGVTSSEAGRAELGVTQTFASGGIAPAGDGHITVKTLGEMHHANIRAY